MRVAIAILLGLLLAARCSWAGEHLAVLHVGAKTYTNVTVVSVTRTNLYFTISNGVFCARLDNLDPAMQQHLTNGGFTTTSLGLAPAAPTPAIERANAQAVMNDAIARVQAIVNQPVRHTALTPDMVYYIKEPGWFHPGAIKPDFNTVDVRTTREPYSEHRPYVTSDITPGVVFFTEELEFNPMTKYFITDRSVPKKRLSEDEMLEINRLYRVIGQCEAKLATP